ncbi:MAG: ABC transporter substrate-binding protein, partial [Candidatus Limnocylindrales bacterium]
MAVLIVAAAVAALAGRPPTTTRAAPPDEVTLLFGTPLTLDPVLQSDIGSAAFSAQLYESLTAFDGSLTLQPALARAWDVSDDGTSIDFHLRDGLEFSDGSALTAADVVGSWLRVIDPDQPSQLSSLLLDVRNARAYLDGTITDPAQVGIRADGNDVVVDLERPGSDFPAIVAGPTFGIVPRAVWKDGRSIDAGVATGSGAYVTGQASATELTLVANEHYWAGVPAIRTAHLLADIGGRSPVAAFEAGDVDWIGIGTYDAAWIRYDRTLGPSLRVVPSLALSFVGFTTTKPPFDDPQVRRAFGAAVDWRRLVELGSDGSVPADSMVPPGIDAGGDQDWLPGHDPAHARELLAAAGFPGGAGFPTITFA